MECFISFGDWSHPVDHDLSGVHVGDTVTAFVGHRTIAGRVKERDVVVDERGVKLYLRVSDATRSAARMKLVAARPA